MGRESWGGDLSDHETPDKYFAPPNRSSSGLDVFNRAYKEGQAKEKRLEKLKNSYKE